jgi:hypothetical protein
LQVRVRGFVQPVPFDRQGTQLEQPQADAVSAAITFEPANLAQLIE